MLSYHGYISMILHFINIGQISHFRSANLFIDKVKTNLLWSVIHCSADDIPAPKKQQWNKRVEPGLNLRVQQNESVQWSSGDLILICCSDRADLFSLRWLAGPKPSERADHHDWRRPRRCVTCVWYQPLLAACEIGPFRQVLERDFLKKTKLIYSGTLHSLYSLYRSICKKGLSYYVTCQRSF